MCRPKDDGNILSKTTIRLRVWSVSHLQWPRQTGHSHEPRKSVSSQTRLPSPSINHGSVHKYTHLSELDTRPRALHLYQHEMRPGLSRIPMQPDGDRLRHA